jgi:hypothetical protein
MELTHRPAAVVVDFAAFRAQARPRAEGRGQNEGQQEQGPPEGHRWDDTLSTRQVEHRRRMLAFLLTARA